MNDIGLIVLKGFEDRGQAVNDYICTQTKEKKNYIIDIENPRFSNGEAKVRINESIRNKDIYIIADIGNYNCKYKIYNHENYMSPDEHYLDLIRTISAISKKAKRVTAFLPLMYASRQHKRMGRESLDCATALRYLEYLGVNSIITFDIHDQEIQNTIPNGSFDSLCPIYPILKEFVATEKNEISKEKLIVISPDTGAMERARKYAGVFNLDIGTYYKRRDYTRVINGRNPIIEHQYFGPECEGKNILIVDDMISSGESIIDIAKGMKEKGCKNIYVATTFAFFTEGYEKFDKLYKDGIITKVYSTNASYISEELENKQWFCKVDLTRLIGRIIVSQAEDKSIDSIIESTDKFKKLISEINKKD